MSDLFADRAADWDSRPVPQQISEGVFAALQAQVPLHETDTVLDFGAGTGLLTGRVAPAVRRVIAVDISPAMLDQLAAKHRGSDKVAIRCQDLTEVPLGEAVDLVVSAMALHHVKDTDALLRALFDHLTPGGRLALADLDAEDGSFHPPDAEGVYHAGFDRTALGAAAARAGFAAVAFHTACTVTRDGRAYPIFLLTGVRPG
jgi:2-polyprenyl-3-methyl-5-hydroxy-6-metoxy-1,4-benzoquinol methylase